MAAANGHDAALEVRGMGKKTGLTMACRLGTVIVGMAVAQSASARTPLMINEDPWVFFCSNPESEMSEAGLCRYIDRFAMSNKVTHIAFCVNMMQAAYPSEVVDTLWRTKHADGTSTEHENCPMRKYFFSKGIDPYAVWIGRCREKGISPWVSMRLNDAHYLTHKEDGATTLHWRQHPELRRIPDEDPVGSKKDGALYAYNYAKPEVRNYQFSIFREIVDRYDADGYELDTLRIPACLTPGKGREEAHFMTEFIHRCRSYTRKVAERRGHPIRLSARVLTSYDASVTLGLDAESWAREDAVDLVVVCNFYCSADWDFDFAGWQRRLLAANPKVKVLPGAADCLLWGGYRLDAAAYRGWADQMYSEGAKGIYLYNTSYLPLETLEYIFGNGLEKDQVKGEPRRHVRTYHDYEVEGVSSGKYFPAVLDCAREVPLLAGQGIRPGESPEILVGLVLADDPAPAVTLNETSPVGCAERIAVDPVLAKARGIATMWKYRFPNSAVRPGLNLVSVGKLLNSVTGSFVTMKWCELDIR